MTTEPKAEGGEAVGETKKCPSCGTPCTHSVYEMDGGDLIHGYTPITTSAVEALARAAEAVYVDSNNEDLWNALEAALAHPEIAALLTTEKK